MQRFASMLLCLLLFAVATTAFASDRWKDVEASMVVTGTLEVNPDGSVYAWALDQQDKLPPAVIEIVKATVPQWKFEPVTVDGKPVLAKTRMSLRIVADPINARNALIRVAGAEFGRAAGLARTKAECPPGACLSYSKRYPPLYPLDMAMDRVSGTVYLVQEIGRDGRVIRQAVRQVDLRRLGGSGEMWFWRQEFAHASLAAAKDWTFHVPTTGEGATKDHWVVEVPINYRLARLDQPLPLPHRVYGQWDAYVPGPVHDVPWAQADAKRAASNGSADAIPDNGMPFVADSRFVLLTPFAHGSSAAPAAAPPQGAGNPGQG